MSLFNSVKRFAASPQGRRMFQKAGSYARSPQARQQLDQVRRRFAERRGGRRR
jgi:hypothetical protein